MCRRINLQAKAYMPFEAFWFLPDKSPPIVCVKKRPEVRHGTIKSAYLTLVPKPDQEVTTDKPQCQCQISLQLPYQFKKKIWLTQSSAPVRLWGAESKQLFLQGNCFDSATKQPLLRRDKASFLGSRLNNIFTTTCKS